MRTHHIWPPLIHIVADIRSCLCHLAWRCPRTSSRCKLTRQQTAYPAIHDDICMFGCTPEEHDEHLLCLMESAKTHGIVFNSAKCHIRQPQIASYGAVFTGQGMWPDPSKIQALQDLPAPDSQTKLQSFLGLINYLQPCIPGLSAKTDFLQ